MQNSRLPGSYWVVLRGKPRIAEWGMFKLDIFNEYAFMFPNDTHHYSDEELDAIIPFPLEMDQTQEMYAKQLMDNKEAQLDYLWSWDRNSSAQFSVEEINNMLRTFKDKRDGKDSRHP